MEEDITKKESIDEGDQPPRAGSPDIGNSLMNVDNEGPGKALSLAGYILDTASVQIPETDSAMLNGSFDSNKLSKATHSGLVKKLPVNYGSSAEKQPILYIDPLRITGFGPLVKGDRDFKTGLMTVITTGICHGVEAYINLGGTCSHYDALATPGAKSPYIAAYTLVANAGYFAGGRPLTMAM